MRKVVITLGKNGSVKSEAFGFKGESCRQATEFLDRLFPVKERTDKDSLYETETTKDKEILSHGTPSEFCG